MKLDPKEKIITTKYDPPPNNHNYSAVLARHYDDPDRPRGWGTTREEAIKDLLKQLEDFLCP